MFMVMFILDDIHQVESILDAWEEAGASGVTILASTGLGRVRRRGYQDDMPLMPSLQEFFEHEENQNRTLVSIVQGQDLVDRIIQATERVVGDLSRPNTGILVVLPVLASRGLRESKN